MSGEAYMDYRDLEDWSRDQPLEDGESVSFDNVEPPAHYAIYDSDNIYLCEVRDIQRHVCFGLTGIEAADYSNAVKYLLRSPYKGSQLDDLKKCRKHIDWLISHIESEGC